jgi:hypothetical protein
VGPRSRRRRDAVLFWAVWTAVEQHGFLGYDTECESDCLGNLLLLIALVAAGAGWIVGLLAGWAHAAIRGRRPAT